MGRVGPAEGGRLDLADADGPDLARLDASAHGSDGFLHGRVGIDAVQVPEIDHVGLQPVQAAVAALADIFGVSAISGAALVLHVDAAFGRQGDPIADVLESRTDDLLVAAVAVEER